MGTTSPSPSARDELGTVLCRVGTSNDFKLRLDLDRKMSNYSHFFALLFSENLTFLLNPAPVLLQFPPRAVVFVDPPRFPIFSTFVTSGSLCARFHLFGSCGYRNNGYDSDALTA
jgi:hypothetical protein